MTRIRTVVAAVSAALLAACSVASCAGADRSAGRTSTGSRPRTVTAGWADRGRTVALHPGDELVVTLRSTYWHFRPSPDRDVLGAGRATVHSAPGGPPGTGIGTVRVRYRAVSAGTTTVTAGRRVCGEALRCTTGQSGYRLTVVVG